MLCLSAVSSPQRHVIFYSYVPLLSNNINNLNWEIHFDLVRIKYEPTFSPLAPGSIFLLN